MTVADLRVDDEVRLGFRWTEPTPEAESALRNSIVVLAGNGFTHHVALRSPVVTHAAESDLEKSVVRILGEINHPPAVEDVRFAFTGATALPEFRVDGPDLAAMKTGDDSLLRYARGGDSATRLQIKKRGDLASAEFESRFQLPSGDIGSMTIAKGNRKITQLERLIEEATRAQAVLPELQSYRGRLMRDAARVAVINTWHYVNGVYIQDNVRVAQKAAALGRIEKEMAATERNIGNAEHLIADRPMVEQDLAATKQAAELAQSLHTMPLAFRFYMVVGGQEVTLLVGESKN